MGNICNKCILSNKDVNDFSPFKFDNKIKYCKVIDVYDGDTITVGIILESKPYRIKVRMYGYDSPELKPRLNVINRDEIIKKAKESRDMLKNIILNKVVKIHISKGTWDKYGRLLGIIYMKPDNRLKYNFNVNEYMINNNYGKPYYGGKKT